MMNARPVVALALAAAVLGCSDKGLLGIEVGAPAQSAEGALKPKAGAGTWSGPAEQRVYTADGGVPSQVVLYTKDGKVSGVRAVFLREDVRGAGLNPTTWCYELKEKQQPEGAKGPLEHGNTRVWATPERLYTDTEDGERCEAGRYDRAAWGLSLASCTEVAPLVERLRAGIDEALGDDGLRMGPEREAAVRRLRLAAAAAELTCPESSGVLTTVGDLYVATARFNGAVERYKKALKLDRDWAGREASDAQGGLGTVAARYRRFDEANERFRLAMGAASTPARKAAWARRYADRLHGVQRFGEAARYYALYLENVDGADPADTQRVYARLARSWIQTENGCAKAKAAVEKGAAIAGTPDRARAELLAAGAFTTIACEPKHKKEAMKELEQAVALDPLMAAEWARLASYYDREANDEAVLQLMLEQGVIDPAGLKNAREYQRIVRDEKR